MSPTFNADSNLIQLPPSFSIRPQDKVLFNVLDYLGSDTRQESVFVCRRLASLFTTPQAYKHFLHRLHVECGIYYKEKMGESYKELFLKVRRRQA